MGFRGSYPSNVTIFPESWWQFVVQFVGLSWFSQGWFTKSLNFMLDKLSSVTRHFAFWMFFSKKKMSSQYQLPLEGILLGSTLTSLPLNFTEVGHIVQWVSQLLLDVPDMSGKFWKCSNCLFILDLEVFFKSDEFVCQKTPTFVIVCEKPSKLLSRKMTNNGEIAWHVKFDSQGRFCAIFNAAENERQYVKKI